MLQEVTIKDLMTSTPHVVEADTPVEKVRTLMHRFGIRHLPVIDDNKRVIGLVSHRDLEFASIAENFYQLPVNAIMAKNPYVVRSELTAKEVVREMVKHKYGSAVIIDADGRIEGIFTSVDGLKILEEMI